MTKDELKMFNIERQIDANINETRKIIDIAYNYLNNNFSLINQEELLEQLEDAEYMLKNSLELIMKLAELYENLENKNS